MNRRNGLQVGVAMLSFVAGLLVAPVPGYSQTEGMERRDDRQDDR